MSRLERLYAEMSDGELLELASDPESLTEAAQAALEQVMRQRRLEAPASNDDAEDETFEDEKDRNSDLGTWDSPGIPRTVAEALEPIPGRVAGMAPLLTLYDGLELSRACAALEEQQIEPAVEAHDGDATGGQPNFFNVWVEASQAEAAKDILRAKLGLFPLREMDEVGDDENSAEITGGEIGDFDSVEEAEEVCTMLLAAGFGASVETDAEAADEGVIWSTVKVESSRREEALRFLEERFASE